MNDDGDPGNRWWSLWWGLAYALVSLAVWYGTESRGSAFFAGAATVYAQRVLDGSIADWKAHWRDLRRAERNRRFAAMHPEIDRSTRGLEREFHDALYPPSKP